jgi:hypothetical protein
MGHSIPPLEEIQIGPGEPLLNVGTVVRL